MIFIDSSNCMFIEDIRVLLMQISLIVKSKLLFKMI